MIKRRKDRGGVFDNARWEEATNRVRTAYSNEGYIRAGVRPVIDRGIGQDSTPLVNLRWEIEEDVPAIINRIEVAGNAANFTSEDGTVFRYTILQGNPKRL